MQEALAKSGYGEFRKAMLNAGQPHPDWDALPEATRDAYRRFTTAVVKGFWVAPAPKTDLEFVFSGDAAETRGHWIVRRKGESAAVGYIVGMDTPTPRFVVQGPGLSRAELEEIAIKVGTLPAHGD